MHPSPAIVAPPSTAVEQDGCAKLLALSPHLSLLLDAVTMETHDQRRDCSEELELRAYRLAEVNAHIARIQSARALQQTEHAHKLAEIDRAIADARDKEAAEERLSAARSLELDNERLSLEKQLHAIERRTNEHALALLRRKADLDAWAAGGHRAHLGLLALQRDESELAWKAQRDRAVDRVVEQLLAAPSDITELIVQRLAARRQAKADEQRQRQEEVDAAAAADSASADAHVTAADGSAMRKPAPLTLSSAPVDASSGTLLVAAATDGPRSAGADGGGGGAHGAPESRLHARRMSSPLSSSGRAIDLTQLPMSQPALSHAGSGDDAEAVQLPVGFEALTVDPPAPAPAPATSDAT